MTHSGPLPVLLLLLLYEGIFLSGFKMSVDELDGKLSVVDKDKGLPLDHVMALKR